MNTDIENAQIEAKKRFLSRFCSNELEIERVEQEIEMWESRAQRITVDLSPYVDGGERCDRIQDATGELVELRALLYEKLTDSTTLRLEIEHSIANMKDERLRLLLELRYIDGLTWEKVAEKLNTEYRWVLRLHKRALNELKIPDWI